MNARNELFILERRILKMFVLVFLMYFNIGQDIYVCVYIYTSFFSEKKCEVTLQKQLWGLKFEALASAMDKRHPNLDSHVPWFFPKGLKHCTKKRSQKTDTKSWVFNRFLNHKACACDTVLKNSIYKCFFSILPAQMQSRNTGLRRGQRMMSLFLPSSLIQPINTSE